jgi:hypothetical protein
MTGKPTTPMTDRPTPETDAEVNELVTSNTYNMVTASFARRLERERDEWRKKAVDLHKQLAAERALADRLHGALDALDFNLAFAGNTLIGGLRERVTAMRAIALPALDAWKEARSE